MGEVWMTESEEGMTFFNKYPYLLACFINFLYLCAFFMRHCKMSKKVLDCESKKVLDCE